MPGIHVGSEKAQGLSEKQPPQWNLGDLLTHPGKDLETLSKRLSKNVKQLETIRPRLKADLSTKSFLAAIRLGEEIAETSSRLSAYAQLWFAQNTKNQAARAFDTTVKARLMGFYNRILFFDLWWQHIDSSQATRFLKSSGDYRYYLETLRRKKDHTLTEAEERVINLKNTTGRSALDNLYDIITNGMTFSLRVGNSVKTLTREQLSTHFRHPSARTREAAYHEFSRVYSNNRDMIGEIYKTLVLDWKNEGLDLRRYRSSVAVRNLSNDIPDRAVRALLKSCRKNRYIFHEYFRIKARICRLKPMTRYHIYAPAHGVKASYPYKQAVGMVLEAYHHFSPIIADLARRVFHDQHIDARPSPGKMGGAFCYSVLPNHTPYVLLNYTGEARDVATLAHELGHAVHSLMAGDHSIFTFHPTLPLAETASVFGEQLLSEALLQQENKPRLKQRLLLGQLDDLFATILRQAYFTEFEHQAHQMITNGATVDALAQTYLQLLREQFGRAVTVPPEFQWEWLSIPHLFRSPFYCYAYSFGNLLVLALYQTYKEQGASFVPKYLDLLATGGSKSPEAMLAPLGVDICSEAFWQSGFTRIQNLVETLEKTIS